MTRNTPDPNTPPPSPFTTNDRDLPPLPGDSYDYFGDNPRTTSNVSDIDTPPLSGLGHDWDDLSVPMPIAAHEPAEKPKLGDRIADRIESSITDIQERRPGWRRKAAAFVVGTMIHVGIIGGAVKTGVDQFDSSPAHSNAPVAEASPHQSNEEAAPQEVIDQLKSEVLVTPNFGYPDEVEVKLQDLNKDPAFRASTVVLYGVTPDLKHGALGTGGLVEKDGELSIQTIEHVTKGFKNYGTTEVYATIPGVGTIKVEVNQPDNKNGSEDISYISLSEKQQELLSEEAKLGVIAPLKVEENAPKVGDVYQIANPETGNYIELTYLTVNSASLTSLFEFESTEGQAMFVITKYNDSQLYEDGEVTEVELDDLNERLKETVDLEQVYDKLCEGYSGSPAVLKSNPRASAGSFSGSLPMQAVDGKECALTARIRLVES